MLFQFGCKMHRKLILQSVPVSEGCPRIAVLLLVRQPSATTKLSKGTEPRLQLHSLLQLLWGL